MNPATTARQTLDLLLPEWHALLQGWAASGELVAAASKALQLPETPAALSELLKQWTAGAYEALPPIALLPASSMAGAAGAYAISTATINLNQDCLKTAIHDWVMSVLTKELGHHLDGILNHVDKEGDEGEPFSGDLVINPAHQEPSNSVNIISLDEPCLEIKLEVEASRISTPISLGPAEDSYPSSQSLSSPNKLIQINGKLIFEAHSAASRETISEEESMELWISDGTGEGTRAAVIKNPGT